MTELWLVVGLAVLTAGAEVLGLAAAVRTSPLVIGLTLVAAGTSMPEMATSLVAACKGERDVAVGNVVGSNIFNLMGVLGLTGLVSAGGLPVGPEMSPQDLPMMVLVAVACLPVFLIGHAIDRWEGAVLLAFDCLYTAALVCEAQGRVDGLAWVRRAAGRRGLSGHALAAAPPAIVVSFRRPRRPGA